MIEQLSTIDTNIFLTLNGMHTQYWDYFMEAFSGKLIWIPLYASIAFILFKNLDWKEALLLTIAIAVAAGLSDMTCAKAIRPFAERLRPSNPENEISALVHIVNGYRGGAFGFPSCHAANSFALAISVGLIFRRHFLTTAIILWAATNSYSRIYLGVHYPGDLLTGAIIGSFWADIIITIAKQLCKKALYYKIDQHKFHHTWTATAVFIITTAAITVYSVIMTSIH